MSSPSRRKNTSVIRQLAEAPYGYSFFQAVRLLERASALSADTHTSRNPVARFTPPATEILRFHTYQSLRFPASEILSINQDESHQWHMLVNFIGLSGAAGVLPYHYTELLLQRLKAKDESMLKFLDLFNHRTTSLFYQAANKYRLPLEYERKKLNPPVTGKTDSHTQSLLSIIGLGTGHLTERLHTRDESLLYYSGLLSKQIRTSTGLRQILKKHFGIPVQIKEFIGQWQQLIDDVRTRLPSRLNPEGCNNCLGKSAMLGRRGWFAQGKIRIILGPLDRKQLPAFAPGTRTLKALNEIVRIYVRMEYDYDFIIRIKRKDIPAGIQLNNKTPPVTGWNTWLSSRMQQQDRSHDTEDILISASRLQ